MLAGVAAGLVPLPARAAAFEWLAPRSIDRTHLPAAVAPPRATPRSVLLISIDGLGARLLARSRTPTLDRLAREGRAAARALTVLPSLTLPAHASMLTGLEPAAHGVLWNRYEPWRDVEPPTVFTVCAQEGLHCGLFAGKRKFAHFARGEEGVERYAFGGSAAEVLAAAERYLRERAPHFVFVHLAEVDVAGHAEGWETAAQRAAVAAVDALLDGFLARAGAALPRPLAVIVTADHGGIEKRHGTDLPAELEIPWIAWGAGVAGGAPLASVPLPATAATLLRLLGIEPPPAFAGPIYLEVPDRAPEGPLDPAE